MAYATALEAARQNARVLLFDTNALVGRKLLVTGNGRCNLSNRHAAPERYVCADARFLEVAFGLCDHQETIGRLRDLGAKPAHEGRVLRAWVQNRPLDKRHSRADDFLPLSLRTALPGLLAELEGLADDQGGFGLVDVGLVADGEVAEGTGYAGAEDDEPEPFGGLHVMSCVMV